MKALSCGLYSTLSHRIWISSKYKKVYRAAYKRFPPQQTNSQRQPFPSFSPKSGFPCNISVSSTYFLLTIMPSKSSSRRGGKKGMSHTLSPDPSSSPLLKKQKDTPSAILDRANNSSWPGIPKLEPSTGTQPPSEYWNQPTELSTDFPRWRHARDGL